MMRHPLRGFALACSGTKTRVLLGLCALGLFVGGASAQNIYPTPILKSFSPAGAKAGSTVEIIVQGTHLDEPSQLMVSNPAIKTEFVPPPKPDPKVKNPPKPPLKFKVTVPANVPLGVYDMRLTGKWGMSNPRVFHVSDREEVAEKEPNNDVPEAQKINANVVVNGAIGGTADVDYFSFTGKKGETILLHCAATSIDSRLNPLVEVFASNGRRVGSNRNYSEQDALLQCVLPSDGDYLIRLCQFTYIGGGTDYFYRLRMGATPWIDAAYPPFVQPGKAANITLMGRNLPGGQPVPMTKDFDGVLQQATTSVTAPGNALTEGMFAYSGVLMPRSASISGIEHRVKNATGSSNPVFLGISALPVILESADNDSEEKCQKVTVPCMYTGRVEKRGDRDWISFTAKKGEVYSLEAYADRVGSATDIYFRVIQAENKRTLGEYDDHTEIPTALSQFYTRTEDPKARLTIPADGEYQVMITSRMADLRGDPRHVYALRIQKETPDFQLMVVGNTDLGAAGLTLRQGSSEDLHVICFRQDGFKGEVKLSVEGLPAKISCPPQGLETLEKETRIVLTAAKDAPKWNGEIKIKGTAIIDGKPVVRQARTGCIVWGTTQQNVLNLCRMSDRLCLAVREKGVFALTAPVKEFAFPIGAAAAIKIGIERYAADFKAQVQLQRLATPVATNGAMINTPNVNLANGKNDAEIKFNIPTNTVPGTYNFVYRGQATYPYQATPKGRKTNVIIQEATPPIKLTVYDKIADVSFAPEKIDLHAGKDLPVTLKVNRLFGYTGPIKVAFQNTSGFNVSAAAATIPDKANEVKLVLKTPANAKAGSSSNFKVRLTATVMKRTLNKDYPVTINVIPAPPQPKK